MIFERNPFGTTQVVNDDVEALRSSQVPGTARRENLAGSLVQGTHPGTLSAKYTSGAMHEHSGAPCIFILLSFYLSDPTEI